MRSASCTTRTGKHAINDATRDKPEVMQMMYWWVKGRPIHKTFFTHCCCSLHDCINKIKGLLPALSDIVSRFSKIIFSCINNGDDKKLVFSSCSGDQLKPPPENVISILDQLHICCKLEQLKYCFWIHFRVSKSCWLQWLVLWDCLTWCSVLVHRSRCDKPQRPLQSAGTVSGESDSSYSWSVWI